MKLIQENKLAVFGIILSLGLIISAIYIGSTLYRIKALDNTLAVTGSAKVSVVSDSAKWSSVITVPARITTLTKNYKDASDNLNTVKAFLKSKGIKDEEINVGTPSFEENYSNQSNQTYTQKEYFIKYYITVNSTDYKKVTDLAGDVQSIINKGVIFQTTSLEYYYSKLPELRISLLGKAIEDAKLRAKEIVSTTGRSVGDLKTASSGVVQVLSAGSTDISDYGTYDTSQINKEVMVTVKASFLLN